MAFVLDEASASAVRDAADARGYAPSSVRDGGLEMLADLLETQAPPKILLLDLDDEADPVQAASRAVSLCGPDCRIIFTAAKNDINLYRRLIQLGGADYLVKPLTPELAGQAIDFTRSATGDGPRVKPGAKNGRIIPVIGLRGGLGATTVAVNIAWVLANKLSQHTCLLDLDFHFGTAALALDREPGQGLHDALQNPERLDGLLIASSMVKAGEHLSLLSAEEPLENATPFDGAATLSLIHPVADDFDMILVDLPRLMMPAQRQLLAAAHGVVIVTDLTLASLRDARRITQFVKAANPLVMPVIVATRGGDPAFHAIDQAVFEKNLEAKIDMVLPSDPKTAKQAANLGKAIAEIAPESPLAKALISLARIVSGQREAAKPESKSLFKSIMGGKKPKPQPTKQEE